MHHITKKYILSFCLIFILTQPILTMPKLFGMQLNPFKKSKLDERNEHLSRIAELERTKQDERLRNEAKTILSATNIISLGSACLLLKGGMALPVLIVSAVSVKLISMIQSHPIENRNDSTTFRICTCLLFSALGFCFHSRAIERLGGVIVLLVSFMAL